jgi:hypothetical protein
MGSVRYLFVVVCRFVGSFFICRGSFTGRILNHAVSSISRIVHSFIDGFASCISRSFGSFFRSVASSFHSVINDTRSAISSITGGVYSFACCSFSGVHCRITSSSVSSIRCRISSIAAPNSSIRRFINRFRRDHTSFAGICGSSIRELHQPNNYRQRDSDDEYDPKHNDPFLFFITPDILLCRLPIHHT